MSHMRPGTKVRFWSPVYKNRPGVEPPGLLKLVAVLAILSIVGVLVYTVALALTGVTGISIKTGSAIYIALVHFLMPLVAVYTISTNSPLSRVVIAVYCLVLYGATVTGRGYLGSLDVDPTLRAIIGTVVLVVVGTWLFGSEKMKVYYAVISGADLPSDLSRSPEEILAPGRLERGISRVGDAVGPIAEILAVIVIIVACIYGFLLAYGPW